MKLTVDGKRDVACQRSAHACLAHDPIGQVILHVGGIGHDIVQIELVQSLIGLSFFIFSEIDLEAVAVGIGGSHLRKRGVSLCRERYVFDLFAVNCHISFVFGLFKRIGKQILPVVLCKLDVDFVDSACVKQRIRIAGGSGFLFGFICGFRL